MELRNYFRPPGLPRERQPWRATVWRRSWPARLVHAVLLDIDHSPSHWLNPGNSAFYTAPALENLADKLHPGGIFGLWSNDPPDAEFTRLLDSVFQSSEPHIVTFPNPYTGGESSSTIYVARKSGPGIS